MLPDAILQSVSIATNLVVLSIGAYYIHKLKLKEQELEKKENKTDKNFHQIVDDALTRERVILEDATIEADQIISQAKYVKQSSQEAIDHALEELVKQIQKESINTASGFMDNYSNSLKQLATSSITDFQNVALSLQNDLKQQIEIFKGSMLPNLEKELEEYKKMRIKQTEDLINKIVEKTAAEVLNKSIAVEDHQQLLLDALEKAKAEGVFE